MLLPSAFPDETPLLSAAPLFVTVFPLPASDMFPVCEEPGCDVLPPACDPEVFPADASVFCSVPVWFCALPCSACAISATSASSAVAFCSSSRCRSNCSISLLLKHNNLVSFVVFALESWNGFIESSVSSDICIPSASKEALCPL